MAQESWPSPVHNNRAVTDLEYERLAARFSDDGVYGTPADPAVVTAGTGLNVNIRQDVRGSLRGHSWYSGADTDTVSIPGNISTRTRYDWVVLRLDRSNWTVRAALVGGTAGGGAPALTQDIGDTGVYEIPLALVTVLGGAASVTVTRAELYVGTRTRPCTSSTRNPNPIPGEMCFETDTGRVRVWTGESWASVADSSGGVVVNSSVASWSWTADSVLELKNGSVHLRLGAFVRTGGTVPDGGSRLPVLIPAAYRHPNRGQYAIGYVTGAGICRMEIYAANTNRAGQVWLSQYPTISRNDHVLPGSGVSWAVD